MEHFDVGITPKTADILPTSRLVKVASFSDIVDSCIQKGPTSNSKYSESVTNKIFAVAMMNEVEWIISESFGGLFIYAVYQHKPQRFDVILEIEMYVYVSEEIYTFSKLKCPEHLQLF